jgi:HAD superfamily hydrolase (TIGR01549 family)
VKYKHLIFDFDGVLVESNEIRFDGFRLLFADYPHDQVQKLVEYAMSNGGMSRYEKIKYFFEEVRNEIISGDRVQVLSRQYTELVKQKVIDAEPVQGSLEFLSNNYTNYDFVIISGSDQEELREVCQVRKIYQLFLKILGSPERKEINLSRLLSEEGWDNRSCLFIGDSLNDLEAAQINNIDFIARESGLVEWDSMVNTTVIKDLTQLQSHVV